ncbi:membrane-associated tyrosine- and threonine-specific cdc2-inhibitory kinase-like [Diabrotica undecimpunctata]|uniref:membrane-associated tyrosine- and threonine-specific cdc2-inhibitory kinase-like n=1 Tax=Diabrotica undecimpunctata TaxID=50387 RepID=UPI003B63833A
MSFNMGENREESDQRRSLLQCPPLIRKRNIRRTLREPQEDSPKAAYVSSIVELNSHYDTTLDTSYFNQIYPAHSYIGEGSFGLVFKATNKFDQKKYAIKKLKSTMSNKEMYAEILNNEKVGLHPNCVEYFMAWEQASEVYMVLEACQMSLADYAKKNYVQEPLLWDALYDICKGLQFLHDKSLIHLDVKPSNIMIHATSFKLADFGTLLDMNMPPDRKKSTLSEGDSKYLALEVLDGIYTPSCDIFGLGLSLLELVCHIELPGSGPSWHELRQRKYPPELNERASEIFRVIIKRMTTNRYTSRPSANEILNCSSMKDVAKRFEDGLRPIYTAENLDDINGFGTEKLAMCQYKTENKENISEYLNLPCSKYSEMNDEKEDNSLNLNTTPESNFGLLSFIHQDSMLERSKTSTCANIVPKVLFSGAESDSESDEYVNGSSAGSGRHNSNDVLAMELQDEDKPHYHSTPISKYRLNKMALTFEDDEEEPDSK